MSVQDLFRQSFVLGFLAMSVSSSLVTGVEAADRKLALLVAAPESGDTAIYNDQTAAYSALRKKGFDANQILSLNGPISRKLFLGSLRETSRRIASWQDGMVFFAFSGHGTFEETETGEIKPGLLVSGESVLWEEVFRTLILPRGVHLVLLPDC